MSVQTRLATSTPQPLPSLADVDWRVLQTAIVGGLALATGVILLSVLPSAAHRGQADRTNLQHRRNRPADQRPQGYPPAATWKIADSWATNLTVLISTLAAVAGLFSDKMDKIFIHQATLAFAATAAILLFVAALSPLVYTTWQTYVPQTRALEGTRPGLLLASGCTLFAVMGALCASLRVSYDIDKVSGTTKAASWILVGIIVVLVAAYAIRTLHWIQLDAAAPVDSTPTLAGIVSVSCCPGEQDRPVRRLSLL